MSEELALQLKAINEKLDRILTLLETPRVGRSRAPTSRPKTIPLSPDETKAFQSQFELLFKTWESGEELRVEKDLDAMEANQLRRFADANNLNVTSKTPKQKVMNLIAGRFRERRQLLRSHFRKPEQS